MLEISLELIDKRTNKIIENDLLFTHSKKDAQAVCEQRNMKCDNEHEWKIGYVAFID